MNISEFITNDQTLLRAAKVAGMTTALYNRTYHPNSDIPLVIGVGSASTLWRQAEDGDKQIELSAIKGL